MFSFVLILVHFLLLRSFSQTHTTSPLGYFVHVDLETSWHTAEAYCQSTFGTHLASVHNITQLYDINNVRFNTNSLSDRVWIGLNDLFTEGTLVWSDDTLFDENSWIQWASTCETSSLRDCTAVDDEPSSLYYYCTTCDDKYTFVCRNPPPPTVHPTNSPSKNSLHPTKYPSKKPTSLSPTLHPTKYPSKKPTTLSPTKSTLFPSKSPSKYPSLAPSKYPSKYPYKVPTKYPTITMSPTFYTANSNNNNSTNNNIIRTKKSSNNTIFGVIIGVSIFASFLLCVCVIIILFVYYTKNVQNAKNNGINQTNVVNNYNPNTVNTNNTNNSSNHMPPIIYS